MRLSPAEHLLAYLIAPEDVPRPAPDQWPTTEALREAVLDGKLPLEEVIAVNGLAGDPVLESPALREVLAEDRARHQENVAAFVRLREKLDAGGIAHVLVKGVHDMPYRSDNIDLLVPEREFDNVGATLERMGYMRNTYRPERYKRLYVLLKGSQWDHTFHLHAAVGWYSKFVDADLLFSAARDGAEAGVRLPRAEVGLAINGCHALYEDAKIKLIELHKIRYLVRKHPIDWPWMWERVRQRGFVSGLALCLLILDAQFRRLAGKPLWDPERLADIESHLDGLDGTRAHWLRHVRGRELPVPYSISKYFARRMLLAQTARTRLFSFPQKVGTVALILREGVNQVTRFCYQPPVLVAVGGADGCGKTTQIERVARALEVFEVDSQRIWIRIGDSPLLNFLKSPLRRHVKAEVAAGDQASEQGVFKSRLMRTFWPPVALADYLVRWYAAALCVWAHQRMVLADRYQADALVDLALRCGPGVLKSRWIAAVLRLLPRPRPAFVLDVPDEVLRERRRGEYVEGVSGRAEEYYRQAAQVFSAQIVPGMQDPEVIANYLTREILKDFLGRFDG